MRKIFILPFEAGEKIPTYAQKQSQQSHGSQSPKSSGFNDSIHAKSSDSKESIPHIPQKAVPAVPPVPGSTKSDPDENTKQSHQSQELSNDIPPKSVPEPSYKPIMSVEDFFNNDIPLDGHSFEESPCYPIISCRPGEIPTIEKRVDNMLNENGSSPTFFHNLARSEEYTYTYNTLAPIACKFCDPHTKFVTYIEFDLVLHLHEVHGIRRVYLDTPPTPSRISSSWSDDFRIRDAINEGKEIDANIPMMDMKI